MLGMTLYFRSILVADIAPNKLLAKLASELKKPDGLTIIKPEEVSRILESMPIQELCGVGKRMQKAINKMSIYTCGELGRCDVDRLNGIYGFSGDNGAATSASLYSPSGVTFDSIGNLYITDYFNQRIRKVYMNRVPTVTALQSSAIGNSSVSGSAVAFTATVTSTENIPTTTITFKDGGATIGSGMLDATGTATFTTSSLAHGSHNITASYPDTGILAGSISPVLVQAVIQRDVACLQW